MGGFKPSIEARVAFMALLASSVGYLRALKAIEPSTRVETGLWFFLSIAILTSCITPTRLGEGAAAAVWWVCFGGLILSFFIGTPISALGAVLIAACGIGAVATSLRAIRRAMSKRSRAQGG